MMDWKGYRWKRPLPYVGYYPGIFLEGLRKTAENLSQVSRPPGRDPKPGPPEYKAGVLTTRPRQDTHM